MQRSKWKMFVGISPYQKTKTCYKNVLLWNTHQGTIRVHQNIAHECLLASWCRVVERYSKGVHWREPTQIVTIKQMSIKEQRSGTIIKELGVLNLWDYTWLSSWRSLAIIFSILILGVTLLAGHASCRLQRWSSLLSYDI